MIKHVMNRCLMAALVALSAALLVFNASAGPVILGGEDMTDHGSRNATGSAVFDGWLYIQLALENLAPAVTVANDGSVAVLGSADSMARSEDAGAAYHFAVLLAAIGAPAHLSGVVTFHDGVLGINQFFANLAAGTVAPAIIVSVGTDTINDQDADEVLAMTANGMGIADFVNNGGGLLAHGTNIAYGWLEALLPGASAAEACDVNTLFLTPAGEAAFPGLISADIKTGPCHNHFLNHGLSVLATDSVITCTTGPASGVTVPESEPNDEQATADPIAIGDDYTAELNPASESDFVSFSASAGQTIIATTVLGTLTDTTLRLLTAGGAELAFNDDFIGFESRIEFTLAAAGTYFLEVQSFGPGCCAGTYTLELRGTTCVETFRDIIIGGVVGVPPGLINFEGSLVAFNAPGTSHTVTVTVVDSGGAPITGVRVDFNVVSGPNIGINGNRTTNGIGQASFTYNSNGIVGVDQIEACFDDPNDDPDGGAICTTLDALKFWDEDCNTNGIPDTCDIDCNGFNFNCQEFNNCGGSSDINNDGQPDECAPDDDDSSSSDDNSFAAPRRRPKG